MREMKRCVVGILLGISVVFAHTSAADEPEPAAQAWDENSSLRISQLEFLAKKWFYKAKFRYESTVVAGGDPLAPAVKDLPAPQQPELLRVRLDTDFNPLIGPTINLSDSTWLDPSTLAAYRQIRTRSGTNDSFKAYSFTKAGVHRLRRESPGQQETSTSPAEQNEIKESFYPYPAQKVACGPISTPGVLLLLASSMVESKVDGPPWICLFDRKRTYRVFVERENLPPSRSDSLEVAVAGRGTVRMGISGVARYRFKPHPLGEDDEDGKEFSFAGLTGEVYLLVDRETALPFRIVGEVSGFGKVEFNLQKVEMESAQPDVKVDGVRD